MRWLLRRRLRFLQVSIALKEPPPPPSSIFLLSSSLSAILAVKNPRSTKAHSYAQRFHNALTLFFLRFSHVSLTVIWALFDITLLGFRLASFIVEEAAYGTPPDGLDHIQSAAFQKDWARKIAFHHWEHDFYLDRTLKAFNFHWLGITPSHAYLHTITQPPSEVHHPLWREAVRTQPDELGLKTKCPLYH